MAKAPIDIRSKARSYTDLALNTLKGIAGQETAPPAARVAASVALLDRGWGKPTQTTDITVRRIAASQIGDDELANIALGSSDGAAEETVDPTQLN